MHGSLLPDFLLGTEKQCCCSKMSPRTEVSELCVQEPGPGQGCWFLGSEHHKRCRFLHNDLSEVFLESSHKDPPMLPLRELSSQHPVSTPHFTDTGLEARDPGISQMTNRLTSRSTVRPGFCLQPIKIAHSSRQAHDTE